jgi:glycosyltransferase involved in cell wall biosynthesis
MQLEGDQIKMVEVPISVVIPAYNAEKYLGSSIESVLSQTFNDFEIIVIDDCSTDGTWKMIKGYAQRDSRIRPYRNGVNLGIAGNRNRGVELARGKYIAWQDADDISLPERLEKQIGFMEANHQIGIIGGYLEIFRDNGVVIGVRKYPTDDRSLRRCIYRYSPVAQPVAMLRRKALLEVGWYDLRYPPAEDLDMTFRIGEYYNMANIPEILLRYRQSPTSAVSTRLREDEINTIKIRFSNFKSKSYQPSIIDFLYNTLHFISLWVIPSRIRIRLFGFFRDTSPE